MATTFWIGNALARSQVVTLTVSAVAVGGIITATINTKSLSYTCVTGDTTTTAATALLALLTSSTAPAEFQEATWTSAANIITATATTPGTPFYNASWGLSVSSSGGATISLAETTTNSSPSDVNDPNNWLRASANSLPVNGDDIIVADSSVPLLWNLDKLSAKQFATFTRWQSFTGTIGLPQNNPLGYYEYRPTYFQFTGPPAGILLMYLGVGQSGSGPSRERYNVGAQKTTLSIYASGSPADDYAVRFLGTHANNLIYLVGTSLGVAMLPAEVATIQNATVDGGGSIALGSGVTFSGTLSLNAGSALLNCAPATITAYNGSSIIVSSTGLTYATVTAKNGSVLSWLSNSTITTLDLAAGCTMDKSTDVQAMTITNSAIDGDTCRVLDPNSVITWTNATTVRNQVSSGPFSTGPGRTWKIT